MLWIAKTKLNWVVACVGLIGAVVGMQVTAQAKEVSGVEKKDLVEILTNPESPRSMEDKEVSKWFKINAVASPVGFSTVWVDVSEPTGAPHSVWFVKTGLNRWEKRGAM